MSSTAVLLPVVVVAIIVVSVMVLLLVTTTATGRHRLNRRLHAEEMAELEAWLGKIRKSDNG